jgi:DNA/RNA endonuclease G (NUC1)
MSPQLADFNRGAWGDLEDKIRGYLYAHPHPNNYF